jgi:hypothetical protein
MSQKDFDNGRSQSVLMALEKLENAIQMLR